MMQGGIASGVVYPPAIVALSREYRFRNIGGASAGAIAAATAAAAEYGRDAPGEKAGFQGLSARGDNLGSGTLIHQLFEPSPETARLFRLVMGLVEASAADGAAHPPVRPGLKGWALRVFVALSWRVPLGFWPGAAGGGLLAALVTRPWSVAPAWSWVFVVAAFAIFVVAGAALGSAWALAGGVSALRSGDESFFGFCSGHRTKESEPLRLTDWLHESVQELAGLDVEGRPLTIDDLAEKDPRGGKRKPIEFCMVTTNLSVAQPVVFPREEGDLFFKKADFARLFPASVVEYLVKPDPPRAGESDDEKRRHHDGGLKLALSEDYCRLPRRGSLPVIVATRLSLSFPLLLGAVRLYAVKESVFKKARDEQDEQTKSGHEVRAFPIGPGELEERWFSDGGIAANFPLSMFDRWVPGRPTFGINLVDGPVPTRLARFAGPGGVLRYPAHEASLSKPEPAPIEGLGQLFLAMLDTARSARDNAQMGLASYRERVVHIYLDPGQGGLNLGMSKETLEKIKEKGERAALEILGGGPDKRTRFNFKEHRWVRLLLLLDHMERELFAARDLVSDSPDPYEKLSDELEKLFQARDAAPTSPGGKFYKQHDPAWCGEARIRIHSLIGLIKSWDHPSPSYQGPTPPPPPPSPANDHFQIDPPRHPGALRVTGRNLTGAATGRCRRWCSSACRAARRTCPLPS